MTRCSESPSVVYTIGHSDHELPAFLGFLEQHGVTAVADVRSSPGSTFTPQYDRNTLAENLNHRGIRYVYLGEELGARRLEPECYMEGKVKFDLVAQLPIFSRGLDRIRRGLRAYRIALMCTEKDPLTCHRAILICRHLRKDAISIQHILEDGTLESHEHAEVRLLALLGLPEGDLFRNKSEMIEEAYDRQSDKIASSDLATTSSHT